MHLNRRRFSALIPAAGIALSFPCKADSNTVRMIVGFAPGGTADIVARALAEGMRASGYNVIVDNRPGAGGRIGTEALLSAPADGNTLLMTPSTNLTLYPHIYANLRYKLTDFAFIGTAADVQFGLAVGPQGPKTLAGFLERAKADPDHATIGTPGAGTVMQLLGDLLAKRANVRLSSIPYKGGAAVLNDVIGGSVASALTALPNLLPMHKSGKLRILAVSSEERLPAIPEVPTFKSAGFPEITASEYICVVAKRGVPATVVAGLSAAVAAATKAPETAAVLQRQGFQITESLTPEATARRLSADSARWQLAVRETGFKPAD